MWHTNVRGIQTHTCPPPRVGAIWRNPSFYTNQLTNISPTNFPQSQLSPSCVTQAISKLIENLDKFISILTRLRFSPTSTYALAYRQWFSLWVFGLLFLDEKVQQRCFVVLAENSWKTELVGPKQPCWVTYTCCSAVFQPCRLLDRVLSSVLHSSTGCSGRRQFHLRHWRCHFR